MGEEEVEVGRRGGGGLAWLWCLRCDVVWCGVQVFERSAEMAKGEKVYGLYRAAYEVRCDGRACRGVTELSP